ncbi:hypothetical protein ASE01_19555 [Nocardioides sp. Root190]|nr:hypothetical protein ASE01_19555 [Nocardioides sp. Root190]
MLTLLAGTVAVLAIQYDGEPIHDVDLNDGGVWVTNSDRGLMARLNSQVGELELGVVTTTTSTDVFQEAGSVQVFDDGGGNVARTVSVVDVLAGVARPVPLPATYEAAAGRTTVAVIDDATGRVWLRRADRLEGLESAPPDTEVSPRSSIAVTTAGTALVLDRARHRVTAWGLDATGLPVQGEQFDFDEDFLDDPELTAVGEVPVVLRYDEVLLPGKDPVRIDGDSPVLQQVGPESEVAQVATETAVWSVPLDGGDAEKVSTIDVDGTPAAPAVVDGCTHAAWNDPGTDNYQRLCGSADPFSGEITPLTDASLLTFRSNRDVVVLNDVANGSAWMVQEDGLTRVDNWDSIDPNAKDPQEAKVQEEVRDRPRNQPPKAEDDEFGARAGATVILPVTLNDVDPDGDILTLKQPPASTKDATYSVVGEGTQVQVKVGPNATGTLSFDYEITDGHPENPSSKATVKLTLQGDGTDEAPELIKDQENVLHVAAGHDSSLNVLPAWIDPEGDSLALVGATSEGGEVGFRPDGTIDFTDEDEGPGTETIEFKVRGGGAVAEGTVTVKVEDPETAAPQAVADHFTGVVGSTILLEPVKNDIDPLGGQLALPTLAKVSGGPATLSRDAARGTATFRADQHGTYYLEYSSSSANGRTSKPTLIRVDVQPASGANRPPVATRDIAAVRPDGSVLVDVLANDADPDGDVLIVQGVEVAPADVGVVKASLINKRFVRVEVTGDLEGRRPELTYLLSDGRSDQVSGAIAVTSADRGRNRRPTAVEDVVTVRAGTVIDIPVVENDSDPDGDRLTVGQQDLFDVDALRKVIEEGTVPIVATGQSIRVLVPDDGTSQLQIGYGVRDVEGVRADTRLVLNIKPDNAEDNQAPQPRPIEDRTVTGHAIRVPVAAFGADPDGDPVVYTSLVEPPSLGRILRSGADWFEYEPFEGDGATGTDSFKIQVTDPYGLSSTADVRIGVAPRSAVNQAPAALDDQVLVKPGLTINYPVLQNDSDPDGDPLVLDEAGFHELADATGDVGGAMRLDGATVEVDVPSLDGQQEVDKVAEYAVSDGLGASSSGFLTVTVREDAPDHAPITQDDVADSSLLEGKQAGDTVDVDVLDNDGDLDGSKADLVLEAPDAAVASVVDRKLRITVAKESQVVPYRVTDATDQSSFGFVYVAGTDSMPPVLDSEAVPVEVTAGEKASIELDDVVVVRAGRTPKVARTDRITAAHGDARAVSATKLEFLAPASYYGAASMTLGVLDGEDQNDPDSLQSQITVPLTVLPSENVAPTVRSTDVVVFAGGDPVTVDLARLASDINEGDELSFEVAAEDDADTDVDTAIDDDVLSISAPDDAVSGEVELTVSADDGDADPGTGRVRVSVIGAEDNAAAQPLMRLRELEIPDAEVGKVVEIDLAAAVLEDPIEESNEVVDVSSTGPASTPSASGTVLRVTPDDAGEIVVAYTMDDGSGEVERQVSSRVVITVAGPPERPNAPRAVQGGPDSVQLTWTAPSDNGSPITGYVVRWNGGDQECVATQCLVDGLDPGETYRFTVEAVNDIGVSDPSAASSPVTPDEVPGQMTAPVIEDAFTDRNGKLRLRWTPPPNEGSDISGYKLVSNPATTPRQAGPGDRSLVWDGLANGTSYTFQILAVNDAGEGPMSPPSAQGVPFTKPGTMAAPGMVAEPPNDDGKGYLTVSWPALGEPDNGYDTVLSYDVKVLVDGADLTTVTVDGGTTSRSFDVENGHSYTAQVRATNRSGTADAWSPQSEAKVAWDKAKAPSGITKASDCVGCTSSTSAYKGRVSFTTPSDNGGFPVTAYDVRTSDGWTGRVPAPTQAEGAGAAFDVPFLSAAQNQSVRLTPITQPTGQGEVAGSAGEGGNFDPYAKPIPPTITNVNPGYRQVSFTYNAGDGNGRAITNTDFDISSTGDSAVLVPATGGGTTPVDTAQGGDQACFAVRKRTAAGGWSDWSAKKCDNADARQVDVYFSDAGASIGGCTSPNTSTGRCRYIHFRLVGFKSGTQYCGTAVQAGDPWSSNKCVTTGGDGRADASSNSWYTGFPQPVTVTAGGVSGSGSP